MPTGPLPRLLRFVDWFVKPDTSDSERQRRWYLAVCLLVFLPTAITFFAADFVAGRESEAVPGMAFALLSILGLAMNRVLTEPRWAFRLTAAIIVTMFTWVVYLGAGGGYAFVWLFVLPPPLYYVFGVREGTAWFLVSLVLPLAIMDASLGDAYPGDVGVRFAVVYALVGLLAFSLERSRTSLHDQLMEEKHQLEVALGEVRTLSGMLPMCAWCRNVRDDDGFWSRIEEYLNRRTGTEVSHGLCPSCAIKLGVPVAVAVAVDGESSRGAVDRGEAPGD